MKPIGSALAVLSCLLNGASAEPDLLFSTGRSLTAKANTETITFAQSYSDEGEMVNRS